MGFIQTPDVYFNLIVRWNAVLMVLAGKGRTAVEGGAKKGNL
jgi:hypothetical protein